MVRYQLINEYPLFYMQDETLCDGQASVSFRGIDLARIIKESKVFVANIHPSKLIGIDEPTTFVDKTHCVMVRFVMTAQDFEQEKQITKPVFFS